MAQTTRIKERQAAQAQRIKQAQAFMVPDDIDVAIFGGGAAGLSWQQEAVVVTLPMLI